jgi:hypothetical protein
MLTSNLSKAEREIPKRVRDDKDEDLNRNVMLEFISASRLVF